mmetsp:Transcript_18058/g.59483  ORF Transcript_18058/g.59483 Transcript_18058/m.59483 type:complete len:304 (+) Transcript_18058:349-1260(+)
MYTCLCRLSWKTLTQPAGGSSGGAAAGASSSPSSSASPAAPPASGRPPTRDSTWAGPHAAPSLGSPPPAGKPALRASCSREGGRGLGASVLRAARFSCGKRTSASGGRAADEAEAGRRCSCVCGGGEAAAIGRGADAGRGFGICCAAARGCCGLASGALCFDLPRGRAALARARDGSPRPTGLLAPPCPALCRAGWAARPAREEEREARQLDCAALTAADRNSSPHAPHSASAAWLSTPHRQRRTRALADAAVPHASSHAYTSLAPSGGPVTGPKRHVSPAKSRTTHPSLPFAALRARPTCWM